MKSARQRGKEVFNERFDQIEGVIQGVAAHNRLGAEQSRELYSRVMLKLVQDDYRVLCSFRGTSRFKTYLTVIVQRVLLDYRVKEWGRWRPCAAARRLGPTAVELDRRINRDGLEPAEAIRELSARGTDETSAELERLAGRIPRRPRRRFVSGDLHLRALAGPERSDRRIEAAERRRTVADFNAALAAALGDLPRQERDLLGMRFGRGWTVRRIASRLHLEERPLYRRFERILRRLRRRLEDADLAWRKIVAALDGPDAELKIDLR